MSDYAGAERTTYGSAGPEFGVPAKGLRELLTFGATGQDQLTAQQRAAIAAGQLQWTPFGTTTAEGYTGGTLTPGPKMPVTRYGSAMSISPVGASGDPLTKETRLRDPRLWYNDPNYGPITSLANQYETQKRDFYDLIGPLVMGSVLGLAGAGAFGAVGAGEGAALSGAKTLGSGLTAVGGGSSAGLTSQQQQLLLALIAGNRRG